jgi:hypothetical protein
MDLNIRLGDHVRGVGATGKKENAIYIGMQLSLADAEALLRPLPQRAQATLVSKSEQRRPWPGLPGSTGDLVRSLRSAAYRAVVCIHGSLPAVLMEQDEGDGKRV